MNKEAQKYFSFLLIVMMLISAVFVIMAENAEANQPPVAIAAPYYQEVLVGEEAWFFGNDSYDPDGDPIYYYWNFGDGNGGWGESISHIYSSAGNYTVWLTVYDNQNGTDSTYVTVTVFSDTGNQPPVAYADPYYQLVDIGQDAWLTGWYSYDPDGNITSYEWDFGDGTSGYGGSVYHSYNASGIYNVTLTVTDNEGATDSDTCIVEVNGTPTNQPPVADANPDSQVVYVGEDALFSGNMSYDPDGNITSYSWNFGDGGSASGMDTSHQYTAPGNYTVTLTVTDNEGATDSDSCIVYVLLAPAPSPPLSLESELVTGALSDVTLSWSASADDGGGDNDITGYTVYKSTTGVNGLYEYADWVPAEGNPTYEWTDFGAGDGDWNNYFYNVRASDSFGNEEENNNKVGKVASLFSEGWNLISVPLVQSDTNREIVLQTIADNYDAFHGYHAGKSRPWRNWKRNKPSKFNDVFEVDNTQGYYIDMLVADYLVTTGKVATQTDINLKTGWNLVGYPCLEDLTVETALSSISGKYNMVEYYDVVSDKEVRLNPDDLMYHGLGYWIHATEDCILTYTN